MAFQLNAFQNLTTHGTKGFQETTGGGAGVYTQVHHHHHAHGGWVIVALLIDLWTRWLTR